MSPAGLDVLAIAAHRDDVEQTCGGTLAKMAQRGQRTGILDLTRGELGTRGTAEDRELEAVDAAKILGAAWRAALDIPDGRVENTYENRLKVARVIRLTRPRVVILPYWQGRHPDHYTCSTVGYESCFLAGLTKLNMSSVARDSLQVNLDPSDSWQLATEKVPHRPFKILYATLYYDVRPTFVVDITQQFEAKLASIVAYKSQFSDQEAGKDIFPAATEIRTRVDSMARFYGMLAGVTHAEPFLQKEVGLVEDLTAIPVKSI
jgi:bacillithiol biosynthesis deacetylase BshB1